MCVLVLIRAPVPGVSLLVAANRDEYYERPSASPLELGSGVFGGKDLQAGGTWLGINRSGLLVAVTNRRIPARTPEAASRGQLGLEALACRDPADVEALVGDRVRRRSYAGFNLVAVQQGEGVCLHYDGALRSARVAGALHVISSNRDLDEPGMPEREIVTTRTRARASLDALVADLGAMLGDHTDGSAICKHGARYGTVSSTIVALGPAGPVRYLHAPGPPCRTLFEDCTDRARRAVAPYEPLDAPPPPKLPPPLEKPPPRLHPPPNPA